MACANAYVGERALEVEPKPKQRKMTQHTYSAETGASIGKYA